MLSGDGHTGCLQRLLEHGAAADAPDAKGTTALQVSAASLNLDLCCSLLLGAGESACSIAPRTAAARGVVERGGGREADVLLNSGAAVDAYDRKRRTASHAAAARDAAESLEILLERGANPTARDARGRTALHYAVQSCRCSDLHCPRTRAVGLLLEAGASAEAEDEGGIRLDVAAEH